MSDDEGPIFQLQDILDDLGGVAEIAEDLGIGIHRLKRWIDRRSSTNCPRPILSLKIGCIYSKADWRGWYALWRVTRGCETWRNHKSQRRTE